ncbi:bifunctional acetate--CoA ligase family protein/GNAT family N-acetyltransferase [Gordonia rhizosphera]|uniref:Putative acetate--CoA ligase n=1 Tax=Gordonia rhizosphera NBRC 16068 TaxID=1108045 RepID=K6WJE0_9ACTN|nr:GNAT family N-acetyltransferase [Gordonia rhizosphera]GAB92277.1 putative acetate--CoA ligase [Gordonia rhizosphera NBRC 16068]
MADYPHELERPGLLRDGRSILIRPATSDDVETVLQFYGRLSRRSVAMRTLGPVFTMNREATETFVNADHISRVVLLAMLDDNVIGMADYARSPTEIDRADIAFTVEDAYQGMGLGGLLLEHLAAAARDRGIEVFEADVLAENLPMIRTLQSSGYLVEFGDDSEIQHAELAVDPRRQVLARSERRQRTAIRSSLHPVFAPRSVAVVGASRKERTVGNAVIRNLRDGGFQGTLHAVNPHATEVDGIPAVPSVSGLDDLDLAVVTVPSAAVPQVLEECASVNVDAVIVVSTEMDGSGGDRGTEMLRYARGHGMRLVGPNCMGVISLRSDVNLVATFSPAIPTRGRVSMASQSGPLGLAVLDHARRLGLGFSGFVSLGDSLDVSPNDLLQWWETDRSTGVVLLHLDTFGNPRKFARAARRLAVRKPVIAVHPGTFQTTGTRVSPSGAPTESDAVLGALFTQAGVIRTRTMQEMFDTALMLAHQPVPPGPRIAILTNAEGPGALAAGACRAAGLVLAELQSETLHALSQTGHHPTANPVDLTPDATNGDYGTALRALLSDRGVDAVIVLFIPPLVEQSAPIAQALVDECSAMPTKPVLASFLSREGIIDELRIDATRAIPTYRFPESAATALGHAVSYGNWLRLPGGVIRVPPNILVAEARILVRAFGPGPLSAAQVHKLLSCFGIRTLSDDPSGQDMTLRVLDDPIFGPVLALGSADHYARLFGDVVYRITPLTDRDAHLMVQSLRSYPVLNGAADRPAVDVDALVDVLLRVSTMVESIPELALLAAHRIRVHPAGAGVTFLETDITLTEPSVGRTVREATVEPG